MICKFTFYPREQKIYKENIQFEIDGLTIVNVIIEGEGGDFRVELAEPKHKIINLGNKKKNSHKSKSEYFVLYL